MTSSDRSRGDDVTRAAALRYSAFVRREIHTLPGWHWLRDLYAQQLLTLDRAGLLVDADEDTC